MFWYVILVVVNVNGSATSSAHYPKTPQYNNESDCRVYGQTLADKIQVERGTNNSKVFWKCEGVSYDTIAKTMPRS